MSTDKPRKCSNCGARGSDMCLTCGTFADQPNNPSNWIPIVHPRICEVLGVEPGEVFSARMESGEHRQFVAQGIRLHHVRADGSTGNRANNMSLWLLEHPEAIIREPRFTEDEVATMRVLYAAGVRTLVMSHRDPVGINRDGKFVGGYYLLTAYSCGLEDIGRICTNGENLSGGSSGLILPTKLFPGIELGQSVTIADIIGK